jgi:PAS domain S-box-containing protein
MRRRLRQLAPHLLVFITVSGIYLGGFLSSVDFALTDIAFKFLKRDASQEIVVVEIDTRSLKELNIWPWPRNYHGQIIDRLLAAGAKNVALDIDFSSHSNAKDDKALGDAITRANGRVLLPVFKQFQAAQGHETKIFYSVPIVEVGKNAHLATVNIRVEEDGRVRRYLTADEIQGHTVTSMAGVLATGKEMKPGAFYMDLGIQPNTIPRLSYVDVIRGNFLNETVAGKQVIVGATAVELGDQLNVAVHKVIPGPVLQALAFETIVQNRQIVRLDTWPILLVALFIAVLLGPYFERSPWRAGAIWTGGVVVLSGGTSLGVLSLWPVIVDTAPWVFVTILSYTISLWRSIDAQTLSIFEHRIEAMHRRAMMNSVVDDSFDGIATVNNDGVIELFNPAAGSILGISVDEAMGQKIHDYLPWSAEIKALYAAAKDQTADDALPAITEFGPEEFPLATQDGRELTIELLISTSRLSIKGNKRRKGGVETRMLIYTFRDITERKKAQQNQERARKTAEAANRAKTEFLANMSHELRTPLNAVIGFSEMIKAEVFGPVGAPQYVEYSTDIFNSGTHLLGIINDVLDMSKIEAGEMELNESPFSFGRIVETALKMLAERAEKGEVSLTVDIPNDLPDIMADERMVKQILLNLLTNAVKFTPAGGKVKLIARRGKNGFVFSVSDTGIGIPPDKMEIILQPFGQADSRLERAYEGTGLGLPLVKSMTELNHGEFRIESKEGEGTTATVSFPPEKFVEARKTA